MTQSTKRLFSMVVALLFLVVSFVIFFELVQPAYGTTQDSRSKLIGEQQSLAQEKIVVTQAKNLINAFSSGGGSQQSNVALSIPTGEDVAGALAQVEGIAQNADVNVTSVAISEPSIHAPASATAGTSEATTSVTAIKPLGSYTLTLAGSASYEDFKNFLMSLETNIRIFDVQGLSFVPVPVVGGAKGASQDLFNYNLTIETYYQLP